MSQNEAAWLAKAASKVARIPPEGRRRAVAIAKGAVPKALVEPFGLTLEVATRVVKQTFELLDIPSSSAKKRRELLTKILKQYALDNPQDREGFEDLEMDEKEEPVP